MLQPSPALNTPFWLDGPFSLRAQQKAPGFLSVVESSALSRAEMKAGESSFPFPVQNMSSETCYRRLWCYRVGKEMPFPEETSPKRAGPSSLPHTSLSWRLLKLRLNDGPARDWLLFRTGEDMGICLAPGLGQPPFLHVEQTVKLEAEDLARCWHYSECLKGLTQVTYTCPEGR